MTYGMTEAQRQEAILEEVQVHREAAALLPKVRKVVNAFDGKVFNCRFENALKEADKRIYAGKEYNHLAIYLFHRGRHYYIARLPLSDLVDGKRIPAEKILESARSYYARHLGEAGEIEEAAARVGAIKEQFAALIRQMDTLRESIPSYVRSIYNMDYRARNY